MKKVYQIEKKKQVNKQDDIRGSVLSLGGTRLGHYGSAEPKKEQLSGL